MLIFLSQVITLSLKSLQFFSQIKILILYFSVNTLHVSDLAIEIGLLFFELLNQVLIGLSGFAKFLCQKLGLLFQLLVDLFMLSEFPLQSAYPFTFFD